MRREWKNIDEAERGVGAVVNSSEAERGVGAVNSDEAERKAGARRAARPREEWGRW